MSDIFVSVFKDNFKSIFYKTDNITLIISYLSQLFGLIYSKAIVASDAV